jgi:hypothetical protein
VTGASAAAAAETWLSFGIPERKLRPSAGICRGVRVRIVVQCR